MSAFDVAPLRAVVARAQREQLAPRGRGDVKRMEAIEAYFHGGRLADLHATVAAARRHTPDTYNLYLSDRRVASAVVDALLGPEDGFQPPQMSFEELGRAPRAP